MCYYTVVYHLIDCPVICYLSCCGSNFGNPKFKNVIFYTTHVRKASVNTTSNQLARGVIVASKQWYTNTNILNQAKHHFCLYELEILSIVPVLCNHQIAFNLRADANKSVLHGIQLRELFPIGKWMWKTWGRATFVYYVHTWVPWRGSKEPRALTISTKEDISLLFTGFYNRICISSISFSHYKIF